jgi:hypothetical protein
VVLGVNEVSLVKLRFAIQILIVLNHSHKSSFGFFEVFIERSRLSLDKCTLEVLRFVFHAPCRVVNLAQPRPDSSFLLLTVDPNASVRVELVVRQEHPAVASYELNGRKQIVHIFAAQEPRDIDTNEAHP